MRELTNISSAVMDPLLAANASGPRITYYDDETGERIELSTATLANWAAKTGNLLRDELGAGPGSRIAVLLPAHWQTLGVLFGVWYIGAEVVLGQGDCDVACCTAERLDEAATAAGPGGEVVAMSLDPFGKPVADLPFDVIDYATSVRVHGDQITPEHSPGPALNGRGVHDVLETVSGIATALTLGSTDRIICTRPWDSADEVLTNVLSVFSVGASLVQVNNPDATLMGRRIATENVTRSFT